MWGEPFHYPKRQGGHLVTFSLPDTCPEAAWGKPDLLTHGREPLWARIVGKVGKIFRKKCCGWGEDFTVVQVQRII